MNESEKERKTENIMTNKKLFVIQFLDGFVGFSSFVKPEVLLDVFIREIGGAATSRGHPLLHLREWTASPILRPDRQQPYSIHAWTTGSSPLFDANMMV